MRYTTQHLNNFANWIGFDPLFEEMDRFISQTAKTPNFPPYNIRQTDDTNYIIEMAIAGFGKDDIDITVDNSHLIVKGSINPDPKAKFIHKGIAERSFIRDFPLAEDVIIKGADVNNGMLYIALERVIPESKKPKKITIGELNIIPDTKQLLTE